MFKLFKDLTRPPEPLSPRPSIVAESSQSSLPYTPRQGRGATPNPVSPDPAVLPTPAAIVEPKKVVEVEESDANARTVAELLKKLEGGGDVMHYVEVSCSVYGVGLNSRHYRRSTSSRKQLLRQAHSGGIEDSPR